MFAPSVIVWMTLVGLSCLFVGVLVVWVYGHQGHSSTATVPGPEAEAIVTFQTRLVSRYYLFGIGTTGFGLACLLTAAVKAL
jgi:hypothetical protein